MSEEKSQESGLALKIATLFARHISAMLSIYGAFLASKPEGKNPGNTVAYKLAGYLSKYFELDFDNAYSYIQARMPEFEVKWAGEEFGDQDDDPSLLEKTLEIINGAIDSLQVEEGTKLAQFKSLVPIELANGVKIAGNTVFFVQYTGKEELLELQKKFGKTAKLESY